jgi:two-component system KDP operon response regulator KdpE
MQFDRKMTTILVADDDEAITGLLESIFERAGYGVLQASNTEQARNLTMQRSPHLIVLDLAMPVRGGLDLLSTLRSWYLAPVLVLSAHDDEAMVVRALNAGADDYVIKPVRMGELLARVHRLLQRCIEPPNRQPVLRAGSLELNLTRRRVFREGVEIRLTRTEFDILTYLLQQRDCVVTVEMLMTRIWGPIHGDYAQTLRVHVGHIRHKLGAGRGLPSYIVTEAGVGYRFSPPEECDKNRNLAGSLNGRGMGIAKHASEPGSDELRPAGQRLTG